MKFTFIKSLFTDEPQQIGFTEWYYIRGKRISEIQLTTEYYLKQKQLLKERLTDKPNIKVENDLLTFPSDRIEIH